MDKFKVGDKVTVVNLVSVYKKNENGIIIRIRIINNTPIYLVDFFENDNRVQIYTKHWLFDDEIIKVN